jgi:signal transduction histidine kinase
VRVSNDGPVIAPHSRGQRPEPGGYGLTGLRERVEMLHGEFRAGPGSRGGFEVAAVLPAAPAGPGDEPA